MTINQCDTQQRSSIDIENLLTFNITPLAEARLASSATNLNHESAVGYTGEYADLAGHPQDLHSTGMWSKEQRVLTQIEQFIYSREIYSSALQLSPQWVIEKACKTESSSTTVPTYTP